MNTTVFRSAFLTLIIAVILLTGFSYLPTLFPFSQKYIHSYPSWELLFQQPDTIIIQQADSSAVPVVALSLQPPRALSSEGPYAGTRHLHTLFNALQCQNEQVRIAYYGDSSIEGDLITQTLRDSLQHFFGGSGVGLLPISTPIPAFRRSVRQLQSDNWQHISIMDDNTPGLPRGIGGSYFLAQNSESKHWCSYRPSTYYKKAKTFRSGRLFYGAIPGIPDSVSYPSVRVSTSDTTTTHLLSGQSRVNELILFGDSSQYLRLDFDIPPTLPLYGISLESEDGVIIDNFPERGNMGIGLKRIHEHTLQQFQQKLDYDLIILQFGLNVLNPRLLDYDWYQKQTEEMIAHFQANMPGVPILVVGVSDKAIHYKEKLRTDPSIPRITKAQRAAAKAKDVAFFSLYEAMGGSGTMIEWVDKQQPPLANSDYTHFNFKGAERISWMLADFLISAYQQQTQNQS